MVNFDNSTNDLTKDSKVKVWGNLAGRRWKCAQSSSSKPGRLVSAKLKSLRRWRTWLYTSTFCLCFRLRVGAKPAALLLHLSESSMITAETTSRSKLWTETLRMVPLKGTVPRRSGDYRARRTKRRRKDKNGFWKLEVCSSSVSGSTAVSWTVWFGNL